MFLQSPDCLPSNGSALSRWLHRGLSFDGEGRHRKALANYPRFSEQVAIISFWFEDKKRRHRGRAVRARRKKFNKKPNNYERCMNLPKMFTSPLPQIEEEKYHNPVTIFVPHLLGLSFWHLRTSSSNGTFSNREPSAHS